MVFPLNGPKLTAWRRSPLVRTRGVRGKFGGVGEAGSGRQTPEGRLQMAPEKAPPLRGGPHHPGPLLPASPPSAGRRGRTATSPESLPSVREEGGLHGDGRGWGWIRGRHR